MIGLLHYGSLAGVKKHSGRHILNYGRIDSILTAQQECPNDFHMALIFCDATLLVPEQFLEGHLLPVLQLLQVVELDIHFLTGGRQPGEYFLRNVLALVYQFLHFGLARRVEGCLQAGCPFFVIQLARVRDRGGCLG